MNCSPSNLIQQSACFCGTSRKVLRQISAYLTCQWANDGGAPAVPYIYSAAAFHENDGLLRVFGSYDATSFTEVSESYHDPAPLRDPTIIYYNGAFWCAYTMGTGQASNPPVIGLASSPDGLTWTNVGPIGLSGSYIPGNTRVWAPSWFIDHVYGGIFLIFAMDKTSTHGSAFVPVYIQATNSSLTAWTAPSILAPFVPGSQSISMIDPFWDYYNGKFYIWFKDDTNKYICRASSTGRGGNYVIDKTGDWAGWGHGHVSSTPPLGNGYEAPCLLPMVGGGFRLYVDDSIGYGTLFAASTDYNTWSALQDPTFSNPSGFAMSNAEVRVLTPPV